MLRRIRISLGEMCMLSEQVMAALSVAALI
jgi:hypothetical protein